MAGWAGFSDEELTRIKQLKGPLISEKPERFEQTPSTNKSRQQLQRERVLQQLHSRRSTEHNQVDPDQQLSRLKMRPPETTEASSSKLEPKDGQNESEKQTETKVSCQTDTNGPKASSTCQELSTEQIKEVELRERSKLEQLQLEQRLMEEKNKRKKALLSKAIAERSKRTMEETVKLKQIQKELQTLDDLLSNDVNILRDRIEKTSLEYYQAKKRYDKAEVEYVAAKLDLYKKNELKEQLTEHLCTIIQQNELRKANKLEELMQQLEIETDEERLALEIEVDSLLKQQEMFQGTDQVNSSDESAQQAVQADHLNHMVKQVEGKQISGEEVSKDQNKSQSENLYNRISEKIVN
ncbi:RAB6-interacting golgin [Rhincodon typus]|uniref:RAB6-interacting golgin n=1 Tax=Rhincodon typus TaxID=259920 RepID=UPI00202E4848|nr:RAB6-interacting golgin [Rhincodon typus]XP_048458145.1 RAB6-interacting golgin [Rhincodon typus]